MKTLAGFPYAEVTFTRTGAVEGSTDDAMALAAEPAVTDLVVLSHGWNNNHDEALRLYDGLATSMRDVGAGPGIGLLGVIWPSKRFDASVTGGPSGGGAAAVGSAITEAEIVAQINDLRDLFPADIEQAILDRLVALVPQLDSADSKREFVEGARSLLADRTVSPEDGPGDFFARPGSTVMERLAIPVRLAPPEGMSSGGAASLRSGAGSGGQGTGSAAGLNSLFGGILGAARNALNITTFYEMKNRAGIVGEVGLTPVLEQIRNARPGLRTHLVGHSFGARLLCAATLGLPSRSVGTVMLLQAAFSHFGLSADWDPKKEGKQAGYFAKMLADGIVRGPILITHSRHDLPVGVAYALASRLRRQVAQGVGDANDIYGGMGRNGAQRTASTVTAKLLPTGRSYTWTPGVPHNLLADDFISDHSAVTGRQVASALISAMSTAT